MLLEVLLLADPYLLFPGTNGQLRNMSECPGDMAAYWKLSDAILKQIETSYTPVRLLLFVDTFFLQMLKVCHLPFTYTFSFFVVTIGTGTRPCDDLPHTHARLFAFAGEIILSAERRAQLDLTGGGHQERPGGSAAPVPQRRARRQPEQQGADQRQALCRGNEGDEGGEGQSCECNRSIHKTVTCKVGMKSANFLSGQILWSSRDTRNRCEICRHLLFDSSNNGR